MSTPARLTLVVLADVPADGVQAFQRYEAAVLPLLHRHDGRLERRLRTADGYTEVHIVSFGSRSAYEDYVSDPERNDHRALLEGVAPASIGMTHVRVPLDGVEEVASFVRGPIALRFVPLLDVSR